MPYIGVKITGKADAALSDRIAPSVAELTRTHLRKDPTVTAIAIDYVDQQHWFAGGRSLTEQRQNSYWLDINVVDGTNTKSELSNYFEGVHACMSDTLGDVHGESYILVHEAPAAAYGFGGKTQEFRFIGGQMGAR